VPKVYGKIKEEERIEQAIASREIVKTVLDYGISQYQIQKIIYLLALELENRDAMDGVLQSLKPVLDEHTANEKPGLITT